MSVVTICLGEPGTENYTGEIFAKHVEDVYRDVLKGVSHGTK